MPSGRVLRKFQATKRDRRVMSLPLADRISSPARRLSSAPLENFGSDEPTDNTQAHLFRPLIDGDNNRYNSFMGT